MTKGRLLNKILSCSVLAGGINRCLNLRRPTSRQSKFNFLLPTRESVDQQQVRIALLKVTSLTLIVTSWIFASFIFATRPSNEEVASDAIVKLVRLPASLPKQLPSQLVGTPERHFEPIQMNVVHLSCWDRSEVPDYAITSKWIRLTGKPCFMGMDPEDVQVDNLSNGYGGTVFLAQNQVLTTDFIPLNDGPNEIRLRFGSARGAAYENRIVLVKPEQP